MLGPRSETPDLAASTPLVRGQNFQLSTVPDSSYCIETSATAQTTGGSMYLAKCNGYDQQRWTFTNGAGGSSVVVGIGGNCWDVNYATLGHQKAFEAAACTYHRNQTFTVTRAGLIQDVRTRKCLTATSPNVTIASLDFEAFQTTFNKQQYWRLNQ